MIIPFSVGWGIDGFQKNVYSLCRPYLGLKGRKMDHGENYIMMNFMTCILRRILLG
jgi:hypothetical protein